VRNFGDEASFAAMVIRKATVKDAAVVAQFNRDLALESEHLRLNRTIVARGVKAVLKDPNKGIYFLAVVASAEGKKEIAGQLMITLEWSDWRNGMFWWIQSVYVRKEFRGQGVFRALYRHVLQRARRQKNVCALRLYVEKENTAALRTYRKLGMKETYYRIFDYSLFGGTAG
jgi:ribosomal protein S18 acetylase RimI-like enzyme